MKLDSLGNCWYKGNLHTHTTNSDGKRSPEEVITLYREQGYDFLALTDHWVLSQGREDSDFLLLSGAEYDTGKNVQEGIWHIVGIGMESPPQLEHVHQPPQELIDEINRCGGLAYLAHPAWSLNRPEQIEKLAGLAGAEIYNTVSGTPWNCRPYSGNLLDMVFASGKFFPCTAADDAHFYNGDQTKSYLMVRAESLCRSSILSALRRGDFYATQGPEFSVEREGDRIRVCCTPVEQVVFFTDIIFEPDRVSAGHGLTEAFFQIKPGTRFVRVELQDEQGRRAWSSTYQTSGQDARTSGRAARR